jgi:hypothetical protein
MRQTHWKNVPVPARMARLSRDTRGFPVPVVVARDLMGKPTFQVNDIGLVFSCIKAKTCSICGEGLGRDMWLIGGPLSAFHPDGAFNDPPVHKECGEYALRVCPYLVYSSYKGWADASKLEQRFEGVKLADPTQMDIRVPFFAFVKIMAFQTNVRPPHRAIIPLRPYLEVEYWRDGARITEKEARTLMVGYKG